MLQDLHLAHQGQTDELIEAAVGREPGGSEGQLNLRQRGRGLGAAADQRPIPWIRKDRYSLLGLKLLTVQRGRWFFDNQAKPARLAELKPNSEPFLRRHLAPSTHHEEAVGGDGFQRIALGILEDVEGCQARLEVRRKDQPLGVRIEANLDPVPWLKTGFKGSYCGIVV